MYMKVVGLKLSSYKHNFGSLKLNILVLEKYAYDINWVSLKDTNFQRMT